MGKNKSRAAETKDVIQTLLSQAPAPGTFVSELPPDGRYERNRARSEAWQKVADDARSRPGEWLSVGRKRSAYVSQVKSGRLQAFRPAGSFEATSRGVDLDGVADLYVRFVGEAVQS